MDTTQASELNNFKPNKEYEFSDLSDGEPAKKFRRRTKQYVVASNSNPNSNSTADLASLPHGEAVLITSQVCYLV